MTFSLLNAVVAKQVEALLDAEPVRQDLRDDERMMARDEALRIIHATIWAYSSRGGDFSGCYALSALADALKDRMPVLEQLATWGQQHSAGGSQT
jgi:hypothetical protein